MAAEPGLQKQRKGNKSEAHAGATKGKYLGGVKTTPIRNVESGAFVMEMWVEEGRGKFEE